MNASIKELRVRPEPLDGASTVEDLAEDMVARWQAGDRTPTEYYLERFPHLQQNPAAVLELLAEEIALCEEYGDPISLPDLQTRFPQWQAQIRALMLCQQTLGRQPILFPKPGETLEEFFLVAELGRGSHGRVYLAAQPALDNRQVVLKLGPVAGHEHLALARLQHSHIVPLYSVHEFPANCLRGLCLPYFGGRTLGDVIASLKTRGDATTGSAMLECLGDISANSRRSAGAWDALRSAPLSDVVCWMGTCLADALQYAHDRGLLHLDLKPSNVLVAADGVPMLLDFHLARPPLAANEAAPHWLGGTPGFMAPEHVEALEAVRAGLAVPREVDGRADVFSLGVVLKKALDVSSGRVSIGLGDILARATAPRPEDRYPTALALADDLRRHLGNQPLRGVPNRGLGERWRKWRRRRPLSLPLLLALGAAIVTAAGLAAHWDGQAQRAAAARQDGLSLMAKGRHADALDAFRGAERLAAGLPYHWELRADLAESRQVAERGQAADDLHLACEQLRPLYVADFATPTQLRKVDERCGELWDHREALAGSLAGQASPDLDRRWRADLLDVAIIAARMSEKRKAGRDGHRDALAILDQAEALLGGSGILYLERARHARELAMYSVAENALAESRSRPPQSAWEHLVLGRHYLAGGDVRRAATEFDRCLTRDSQQIWGHYYKGLCSLRLGRPVEAVAEFSICTALAPDTAWCVHNLGRAYEEAGELVLALEQFDRALALDPGLAASLMGRAGISQKKGRYADALADLRSAADAGITPAEVYYRTAMVLVAMGNRAGARESLKRCLELDPRHIPAQDLSERIGR